MQRDVGGAPGLAAAGKGVKPVRHDWLWGVPLSGLKEQREWVDKRLAEDPVAAAISDAEAEDFFAVSYVLRYMGPSTAQRMWRVFGVRVSGGGEKAMRFGVVSVLRQWKVTKSRELMLYMLPNLGFPQYPDPAEHPDWWTEELFYEAYHDRANIVWLVKVRRHLGKTDDLPAWFRTLGDWVEEEYRLILDVARLTLRRLVYPHLAPGREVAAAAQATLADLREKDRLSGTLRQDVRRLEQDRKQLKERARRAEQRVKAMLSQARGEVAAARRSLKELPASQQQELAGRARVFEQELNLVRNQLSWEYQEFKPELAPLWADLLHGRKVTVVEAQGIEPFCRLLVESLGGTWAPEGGGVELSAAGGLAALERELRSLALQRVLIQCDGLYRRKEGRHGVAVAGFQARAGDQIIWRDARTVSCGPLAGSLMAEYGAVVMALNWLVSVSPPPSAEIVIWSDCRALLSRLRRTRGVRRKAGCVSLDAAVRRAVRALRRQGCAVQFRWVPRDEVEVVDRLCDRAYRGLTWYHRRGSKPRVPLKEFFTAQMGDGA